ncbi:hypothetical protein ACWGIN_27255 [Streptomyces sp. NPDC054861]
MENHDEQVRQQLTEELVRLAFRQAEGHHLDAAMADMDVAAQIVGGSMLTPRRSGCGTHNQDGPPCRSRSWPEA